MVTGHAAAADGAFELTISKADGTLGPYVVGGRTLFEGGGGALHLYRAPTENDAGDTQTTVTHPQVESEAAMTLWYRCLWKAQGVMPPWLFPPASSHDDLWRRDGLHALERRAVSVRLKSASRPAEVAQKYVVASDRIELIITLELCAIADGALRATHQMELSILPTGAILLENTAQILAASSISLPRVGLRFRLPREAAGDNVAGEWYGRGPHENYPDRQTSAFVGVHTATAAELAETLGYAAPELDAYATRVAQQYEAKVTRLERMLEKLGGHREDASPPDHQVQSASSVASCQAWVCL